MRSPSTSSPRAIQRYGPVTGLFNALWAGALAILTAMPAAASEDEIVIAALGDSLTAGFGVAAEQAFPARLQAALGDQGVAARVIDAGVSGDTTTDGLARLDRVLGDDADLVIVELGANDGLSGLDPDTTLENLDAILARLREREIAAVLTGMLAPPNLGAEYGAAFNGLFQRLAADHDLVFYPFFLDGVAARPTLNQSDGIHPNAAGVDVIVAGITPYILDALRQMGQP